jgi:xanthine dehydrogenase accessory factor
VFAGFIDHLKDQRPVAVATLIQGPTGVGSKLLMDPNGIVAGSLGAENLDARVLERSVSLFADRRSETLDLEQYRIFIEVHLPPPRVVIVGAVHIATTLSLLARKLGFRVVVTDARARFATPERLPDVDDLILGWPDEVLRALELDESSYVVVLTHDAKLDNPALLAALRSSAPYIGALGSRKTHARRVAALRSAGATDEDLQRIHAPVGLEIGARTPVEFALAILAEVVAVKNGATRSQ